IRLLTWGSTTMTTLPPRPPLPPSGPPSGMFFSRRKLQAPGPPLPARATMRTRSTNIKGLSTITPHAQSSKKRNGDDLGREQRQDVDPAVDAVELDHAVDEREERVIAAHADVRAGMETRAALANNDVARDDFLAAEFFHAEALADAIAPVAYAALTFFMRHSGSPIRS